MANSCFVNVLLLRPGKAAEEEKARLHAPIGKRALQSTIPPPPLLPSVSRVRRDIPFVLIG